MVRSSAFAFVLLAAGCARNWGPAPSNLPTPLRPEAVVRIWSGGEVKTWHAVIVTEISVSGIPSTMPVTCDSCVLRIPRTQVDSMKVVKVDYKKLNALEVVGVVGILAVGLLAAAEVCHLLDPHNHEC